MNARDSLGAFIDRLREWSRDEAHLVQSVRMHEPTYKNPGELRRDVRALLARLDGMEDIARAAITWAPGNAKIALCQRLEDVLSDGE